MTVLVVEDHEDVRDLLALVLEAEGFEVSTAANGLEALQRLNETRPALILLDLMMPVMTGDEFRQRQLEDPRVKDVPVICLTATFDGLARAEQLHASACFEKPVDLDTLLKAVHRYAHD